MLQGKCFGCPTQPVSTLDWFKSPCICTTTAETVEGAAARASDEGAAARATDEGAAARAG